MNLSLTVSPYDALYRASPSYRLWGDEPGRLLPMVPRLAPGRRVFDAGCGDGKNALFLEEQGFEVFGVDSSPYALSGLFRRFEAAGIWPRGHYVFGRVEDWFPPTDSVDVLISYGLLHCLAPRYRPETHRRLQAAIRPGGIAVVSCLTTRIPLPDWHGTPGVIPLSIEELVGLFDGWTIEFLSEGEISESHPPKIPFHVHSAAWLVGRRSTR